MPPCWCSAKAARAGCCERCASWSVRPTVKTTGAARTQAYINLDLNITKQAAPWASFLNLTNRDFLSSSTGCYVFQPVFLMDWAVTCKK